MQAQNSIKADILLNNIENINIAFGLNKRNHSKLYLSLIPTDLGTYLCADKKDKLCALYYYHASHLNALLRHLAKHHQTNMVYCATQSELSRNAADQLQSYLQGKAHSFNLPLTLKGTLFQEKVWHFLQTIPYATTLSYREEALLLAMPSAIRAVANANACNPIEIIVPCHRVVGSNHQLGGYRPGLKIKQKLLALEFRHIQS